MNSAYLRVIKKKLLKYAGFLMIIGSAVCFLNSCFTGIESTKKISLSREDKKNAVAGPEEQLMNKITPSALVDWDEGKKFIVSDNKALLVIIPREGILPYSPDSIQGETLYFTGVDSKMNLAGDLTVDLLFTDGSYIYSYSTGKEFDDAMQNVWSNKIPMLIDFEMVEQARTLLLNKILWTKSNLWYDESGNRVDGRKYVEVTVKNVEPGNLVFPLKLEIETPEKERAFIFINFGNDDNESRAFHNIFSLTNIRKHYTYISDETWDLITRGKVIEGMTKEECRLSLGNPIDINSGHDYSQTLDIWTYDNGRVLWFEDGKLTKIR